MERKIGEIFKHNGEWYQCLNGECTNCDLFIRSGCSSPLNTACGKRVRKDKQNVIFKKLEKVGEPIIYMSRTFQKLKSPDTQRCKYCYFRNQVCNPQLCGEESFLIEIKQTKEDMEEKGQCCDNRFEIIAKAKEALLKETNIARDEQEMAVIDNILFRCWQMGWLDKYDDTKHSNSEKVGKNLRPFDLQKAREGKPVCTRDRRKARIIAVDLNNKTYPLAAVIENNGEENEVHNYTSDGLATYGTLNDADLMIITEKKEGWVNVYKGGLLDTKSYPTKKEAFDKACPEGYVDTVKVCWEE